MKRVCAAIAMACVSAVALGAQQQTTADPAKASTDSTDQAGKITVTGCVQPADAGVPSATGTSGSTTTATGSATMTTRTASFILTNAVQSPASPSSSTPPPTTTVATTTTGTSGSTTTAIAPAVGVTYRLDGDNLGKYVGKRVEVIGRIDSSATMNVAPSTSTSTSASSGVSTSPAHLKVTDVREIGDCLH